MDLAASQGFISAMAIVKTIRKRRIKLLGLLKKEKIRSERMSHKFKVVV